eukprot:TRINITY_DN54310_c0_g1_i1.p1 TRINITY_DN54310_c0_g1~~TRINITY_DN54310_c0_g1_i1.p1  ORF type:complete len:104 (+),score=17.23 TRINITY_DN54310_c0_g1_i1:129-440(+)
MIRRPPRSTLSSSSAASDVYKRQYQRRVRERRIDSINLQCRSVRATGRYDSLRSGGFPSFRMGSTWLHFHSGGTKPSLILEVKHPVLCVDTCLLYTSPSPRDS